MKDRILDNALMALTIILVMVALGVGVVGVIELFVHGFNWVTLDWTIGAYIASGLLYSVIARDYIASLTWVEEA